ncbi:galactose/methyl galactoside ABC transporter permease MglC [Kingella negevensis]|nr:galactose/methyl galactoside ABC transporter permease MglC [Kingella negevensis]
MRVSDLRQPENQQKEMKKMNATTSHKLGDFLKNYALYFVLLLLLVVIVSKDTSFLSLVNFSNILTQSSVRVIIALGVAGLIVTQGTDLSVGRQVGLSAVVAATLLQAMTNANKVFPDMNVVPIPLVILLVCAIGAVIGLVNGLIVTVLNVTPFIATLGTMLIIYGINSLYYDFVGSAPIAGFDSGYSTFTQGFISLGGFRLSYITIYALIAVVLMWVLWNKTRFGKNLFAIGGNPEAAKVSGVNVTLNLIGVYTLSGVFYAFGGFLEAGRIGSATNNLGFMYEMDAIAACVIGGVSFSGGVGSVVGVVMGVLIFTLINYGLSYIGVSPYWQYIIKGTIIVMAVTIDSLKNVKKK